MTVINIKEWALRSKCYKYIALYGKKPYTKPVIREIEEIPS